jgi:hypothetical protein
MSDVVVNRCTLRVVRRGGWNWGPEPKGLVQAAVHALPELIARRLAELWPDDEDSEITSTVRIGFPIEMAELLACASGSHSGPLQSLDAAAALSLEKRLDITLRRAFGIEGLSPREEPERGRFAMPRRLEESIAAELWRPSPALSRALLAWREQDVLADRLADFSPLSIETWHRGLWTAVRQEDREEIIRPEIAAECERVANDPAHGRSASHRDPADLLFKRLVVAVEVATRQSLEPDDARIWRALDRVLPLEQRTVPSISPSAQTDEDSEEDPSSRPTGVLPRTSREVAGDFSEHKREKPKRRPDSDVYVSSALPLLLLGPLARVGYLQTLAATLAAAERSKDAVLFAVALAHKVLDKPLRGWRRSPAAKAAAAAFAGLEEPPPEPALVAFADAIGIHLSPLDAVVSGTLIGAHERGDPVLLYRLESKVAGGFGLFDCAGCFPLAWTSEPAGLFPTLRRLPQCLLLVAQEAADPGLLREIDAAGIRFVTDSPQTRGENWREVSGSPGERWRTNDRGTPADQLVVPSRRLAPSARAAADLFRELIADRPSVPLAGSTALDRTISLAAALALGFISWTLWRERPGVSPLMALEYFQDFDARISFGETSLRVHLPLGQRFLILEEHRLLKPLAEVPWLGGRTVEFTGG